MVSIPNPLEAAIAGFCFTIMLLGAPAAAFGALIGGISGFFRARYQRKGPVALMATGPP